MNSGALATLLAASACASIAPLWGCGLLGPLPGISANGTANAPTQFMIDGLKRSSDFGKVSYWNWDLAPDLNDDGSMQHLTSDFIFMPDQWGVQPVNQQYLRAAGASNFPDGQGNPCPAQMASVLIGANEPDIKGSCMGDMMGKCTGSCTSAEVASGCPIAHLSGPAADPLPDGHCDCWSDSHATGAGFWPVDGCSGNQPLPSLFSDPQCTKAVIDMWKQTAASAHKAGYKFLATPMMAVSMDWQRDFVSAACTGCSDVSCGCPTHLAWHFYAQDCQPVALGGYEQFQTNLNASARLMEDFPNLQGVIINEVGMLNCKMDGPDGACVPNGPNQKYPANAQPNNACPKTKELPDGFGSFISDLMDMVIEAKTKDGRPVVASFSWFNENMAGGTYNLRLFDADGSVNDAGVAYINSCQKWFNNSSH